MSACLFSKTKKHCWHWSQYSHTIYDGADCSSETFLCCWCGMESHTNLCVNAFVVAGHGPHSGQGYIKVGPAPDSTSMP